MLTSHRAGGFTLIETSVALSLMLAGIAGGSLLLFRSVQHERESATRRTAIGLAGSLAEELRVLRPSDPVVLPADAPAIVHWRGAVLAAMPRGTNATVERADTIPPRFQITIAWPVSGLGMQQFRLAVTP